MRMPLKFKQMYLLLPLLSVCLWTIGCGQPPDMSAGSSIPATSPPEGGDEAGGGTALPGEPAGDEAAGEAKEGGDTQDNAKEDEANEGAEGTDKKEGE